MTKEKNTVHMKLMKKLKTTEINFDTDFLNLWLLGMIQGIFKLKMSILKTSDLEQKVCYA